MYWNIISTFFLAYLLTFFLPHLLTFYLACVLTFLLASLLTICWHSLYHICWHSFWHSFWYSSFLASLLTFTLTLCLTYLLNSSDILSGILSVSLCISSDTHSGILSFFWHIFWPTVEVRRGTLPSGSGGWGPAGNTAGGWGSVWNTAVRHLRLRTRRREEKDKHGSWHKIKQPSPDRWGTNKQNKQIKQSTFGHHPIKSMLAPKSFCVNWKLSSHSCAMVSKKATATGCIWHSTCPLRCPRGRWAVKDRTFTSYVVYFEDQEASLLGTKSY